MFITSYKKKTGIGIYLIIDLEKIKHLIQHIPTSDTSQVRKDGLTGQYTCLFSNSCLYLLIGFTRIKQGQIGAAGNHFHPYRVTDNMLPGINFRSGSLCKTD